MNGNVLSRVTLCGVLGLVAAAHGQVRKVPTAFMWQSDPGSGQNPPVYNPRFVSMQSGAVHEEPDFDNPVGAANRLALKIHTNFVSGSITADNIAIYLHGFGYDHTLCDIYPAAPCPDDNLVTRFFTDEDALLLGMDEDDFPDRPLPNRVNEDARTFRHPFLRNATKQGPLRVWAEAFMDAFDAKITQIRTNPQHNPYLPDLPHPSVYRWYFDTEAWFALPGNRNGVFMLRYIAEHSGQGSVPDIWNTWKVPGSEGWDPPLTFPGTQGQTLAQMYAAGVAEGCPDESGA